MTTPNQKVKTCGVTVIKRSEKVAPPEGNHAILPPDLRAYYESEWHRTLMKLAALSKLLKISRRCRHCGNVL